jgi:hypothetical protein
MRIALRAAWLLAATMPAWGLSNAVTLADRSGAAQTNRVVTVPRYFANKEICGFARPYAAGAGLPYWQADVKNRWAADTDCAAGYVKFALITIETSIPANGALTVEFRSSATASSGGAGLSKSAMLSFDAGGGPSSWGAGMDLRAGAIRQTASARAMLASDHYQVLESGPLRTSLLIREGPDAASGATTRTTSRGFRCTGGCVAPYDGASWADDPAYYSMRPSFVVTFYTSPDGGAAANRVETDYLLDNSWMDRAQDQRLDGLTFYTGGGEDVSCYTAPAAFVLPFRSRVSETCWSTAQPALTIDFNRAYVVYSKIIPAYGLDFTIGSAAIALETADFNATDQGQTTTPSIAPQMGWGQMTNRGGSTGGGYAGIGWAWRFTARYVMSFDPQLLAVVLGNAKAQMHIPLFYAESSVSALYHAGNPAKAFGRSVSIEARPTFSSSLWNISTSNADAVTTPAGNCLRPAAHGPSGCGVCSTADCMVTVQQQSSQIVWASTETPGLNAVNNWGQDIEHSYEVAFVPYLFTGKRVYLESLWAVASWLTAQGSPADSPGASRMRTKGLVMDGAPRGMAWPMRTLGAAAAASPDGAPEQAYFLEKLENNLEMQEGRLNIRNGRFAQSYAAHAADWCQNGFSAASETSAWWYGRCFHDEGLENPLGMFARLRSGDGDGCYGCDGSIAGAGYPAWMHQYALIVFNWLTGLGYEADFVTDVLAKWTVHLIADSAYSGGNAPNVVRYYIPGVSWDRNHYLQTWSSVAAAFLDSAPLARDLSASDTTMYVLTRGDTISRGNNLDLNLRCGDCYWKVDNEVIRETTHATMATSKTVTAIDAATGRVTSPAHGYTSGQRVRVYGSKMDSGVVGSALCKVNGTVTQSRNNDCDLWVKVIDANTVEWHSNATLTSRATLAGDGTGLGMNQLAVTITRGALGTAAAPHPADGRSAAMYPITIDSSQTADPSGSHAFMYMAGASAAVDRGVSVVDEGTGQTITARRAFEQLAETAQSEDRNGSGLNCAALSLSVSKCDNPQWAIRPAPQIRNLRVIPAANTATFVYTAPDGNACRIGVSAGAFSSTDDSADAADGSSNLARAYNAVGLIARTTYFYRITCGPRGGAARASGTFQTN